MLRSWILGLTAGSILCASAEALSPGGNVGRVLKLVCGTVLLSLLLSPLLSPDRESYSFSAAAYTAKNLELRDEIKLRQDYLSRVYIEQECAAYILDEARALNMEGTVEVRAEWIDSCFVPVSAELTLRGADGRERLSRWMEAELGIPEDRQVWHDNA